MQQAAASVIDIRATGHLDAETVRLARLNVCGQRELALWLQACLPKCLYGGLMQPSVQCSQYERAHPQLDEIWEVPLRGERGLWLTL